MCIASVMVVRFWFVHCTWKKESSVSQSRSVGVDCTKRSKLSPSRRRMQFTSPLARLYVIGLVFAGLAVSVAVIVVFAAIVLIH